MKKVVIVYKTKYGTIKEYSFELAKRLNCDCFNIDDIKKRILENYDIIIYGGGVHAGGIRGFDDFSKWIRFSQDKTFICIACGMNVESFDARSQLRDINFNKDYLRNITCYYLNGRFNPNNIKGIDKTILKWTRNMLLGKGELNFTKDDKELLNRLDNGYDGVDFNDLDKIVKEISEMREE